MTTPFFPSYRDNWTRTPNIFFEEILPKSTLNESRIVGYLFRQTLGYNQAANWVGVTRNELIQNAGVSNGQLTSTLKNCESKGWILTYVEGPQGNEKRYIFLNDPLNLSIVSGLKQKL